MESRGKMGEMVLLEERTQKWGQVWLVDSVMKS